MHPHPPGYVARYAKDLTSLTGKLSTPRWKDVPWAAPFQDIEGPSKPKPRHDVKVKMLWNEEGLMIGAWLEEPHLWATYTQHDSIIYHENDFEWFIDPDGDAHAYYEWEVNALGTSMDLFMDRPYLTGGNYTFAWQPTIQHKVFRQGTINDPSDTDEFWSLECFIPWSQFDRHPGGGQAPKVGDQWRISFSRVQWDLEVVDGKYVKVPDRHEHNWTWTNQHAINMHLPWYWGYVQFEKDLSVGFRPDPDHEERMKLVEVFDSMRSRGEGGIDIPPGVELKEADGSWEARVRNDEGRWLTMNHLGRIVREG